MSLSDLLNQHKLKMPKPEEALPGRAEAISVPEKHYVTGHSLTPPFPEQLEIALFGLGCFWGAERKFWQVPGVYSTAVGYTAGYTPNPSYEEVCTGKTGHNEAVLVVFDPTEVSYQQLLEQFWQSHNPTQYMRQGNDVGTQYRSGIYVLNEQQRELAEESKAVYTSALQKAGFGEVATEILPAAEFYYAEHYHQQYLAKNPDGYCGLGGTGVVYSE